VSITVNLHTKVTLFFVAIAAALLAVLVAISLYAFRSFSIASATDHIRTAGEIVRVHLTESMINGVIDKRESFLKRLVEVQPALGPRHPFAGGGKAVWQGLNRWKAAGRQRAPVMAKARHPFMLTEGEETIFRGTIPYIASASGTPNCLQCHQVSEGTVLGAVSMSMSIDALRLKSADNRGRHCRGGDHLSRCCWCCCCAASCGRFPKPPMPWKAPCNVRCEGDFKAQVVKKTNDEIGQIATDMNRLLSFLDDGLNRIGMSVARLTDRTPTPAKTS
jgi:hypothetical protein